MDFNLLPYSSTPTMSVPIKGPRLKLVEYRSLIYLQMQKLFISLDLSFISVSTSNLEFPGASLIAILGASTDSSNTPWEFLQSPSLLKWTSIVLPRSTSYLNCYLLISVYDTTILSVTFLNSRCGYQGYLLTCPLSWYFNQISHISLFFPSPLSPFYSKTRLASLRWWPN